MKIEAIAALEAERTLLGSLLDDPRRLGEAAGLTADHFFSIQHRAVWEAVSAIEARGAWAALDAPGAIVTVWDEITKRGERGRFNSEADLTGLLQTVTYSPLSRLADQMRAKRRRVELASVGRRLAALVDDPTEDEEEAMSSALEQIAVIAEGRSGLQRVGEWDCYPDELEARVVAKQEGKKRSRGVSTYIPDVDRDLWRGFRGGNLYVFAGRPGDGKSSLVRQMMLAHANTGGAGLIFNGEMSREETRDAFYPVLTGISSTRLDEGDVDYGEFKTRVHPAWSRLRSQDLSISPEMTLESMESIATQWAVSRVQDKPEHLLPLIAVDYLQLVRMKQRVGRGEAFAVIKEISRRLKLLAMRLRVPVIALSRLNRTGSKDEDPDMHDLAEAGSVEYDATAVGMVQVERNSDRSPTGRAKLRILKQRGGPVGEVELSWDAKTYTFGDWR